LNGTVNEIMQGMTIEAGPEENKFQFSCPWASRLEMHVPNKYFHLPNKFPPDPKLSFIFKSAMFHLPTYKYVFAIQIDKC